MNKNQKISKSMKGNKNSKNHDSKKYRRKQSKIMREVWKRRREEKNDD